VGDLGQERTRARAVGICEQLVGRPLLDDAAAVEHHDPVGLLAHPDTFILLAALLSVGFWMLRARWPRSGLRTLAPTWLPAATRSSWPVLMLACVATVMSDAGMVRAAVGARDKVGEIFRAVMSPGAVLMLAVVALTAASL
jgi:hypothetical protein